MYFAGLNLYTLNACSGLTFNSAHIYRMEWDGAHCWVLYVNYNVYQDSMCDTTNPPAQVPRSGTLEATSEIDSKNGSPVEMPTTIYGYSDPNTNNALRIRGAAGYVPWTPNLSTGGTIGWDERYSTPTTYISAFNLSYKIEGCGQC
jgi:hypothetical protein